LRETALKMDAADSELKQRDSKQWEQRKEELGEVQKEISRIRTEEAERIASEQREAEIKQFKTDLNILTNRWKSTLEDQARSVFSSISNGTERARNDSALLKDAISGMFAEHPAIAEVTFHINPNFTDILAGIRNLIDGKSQTGLQLADDSKESIKVTLTQAVNDVEMRYNANVSETPVMRTGLPVYDSRSSLEVGQQR